jgi:hypothetical protein
MAGGTFTLFNLAKKKLSDGTFDLDTNVYKMALTTSAQSLTATFVGSSTDCRYADLTNEVANGNGYTTGGVTLANKAVTQSGKVVKFDADDVSWTNSTITARYAVIRTVPNGTAANQKLLAYVDFGVDKISSSGTFAITWNASGIFTDTAA